MLEVADMDLRYSKEEYDAKKDELTTKLVRLQQTCIKEKLPVVICVDGWAASGKGTTVSKVVKDLDPRAFAVHPMSEPSDLDRRYPFIKRFWERIGQYGTITIFSKSWYSEAIKSLLREYDYGEGKHPIRLPHPALRNGVDYVKSGAEDEVAMYAESARLLESQLIDDGYLIIKCFFHVSEGKQKKRLEELSKDKTTAWRVSRGDLHQNRHYGEYYPIVDRLLEATNAAGSKWHVIPADNRKVRRIAFLEALVDELEEALERRRLREENPIVIPADFPLPHSRYTLVPMPDVESISHNLTIDDDSYERDLKTQQRRLSALQMQLYHRGIPMMLVFEGWDAAGKGGAIKRVASALDARDYRVVPSASPTPVEKQHPFLWRYWTQLPKSGHVAIYDRSWYGRVMVERIEGFCTDQDWRRAFGEINDFEWEMYRSGTLLLKFWINISQEEQLARFEARKNDPDKAWKLTDEDWRNRDKYPQYREAINDMFRLTSTNFAPWQIVESDDKKYARIKVLKAINAAIEDRLRK